MTLSLSICRAAAFALGLATTLALLGVISSSVGNAYGQIGDALPLGKYAQLTRPATSESDSMLPLMTPQAAILLSAMLD